MILRRYHKKKEIKEVDYSNYTVRELRKIAKDRGIKGYSDMVKDELIKVLAGD
jgi:hypothetical protein|nr:MAG TPA: transcription termination factor Rho [Caudoviricetes sp.]